MNPRTPPGSDNPAAAPRAYQPTMKGLHWLSVLLIATSFGLAFTIDLAPSPAAKTILVELHRSIGVIVWFVTLGRLGWRQRSHLPDWPPAMPHAIRLLARSSEYALYALLLAQPVLGLLQTNARGNRVDLFFLGQLPALIGQNLPLAKLLLAAHKMVGLALLALIALHASAALYHHFWRHDDTLLAMLPRRKQQAVTWDDKPAATTRSAERG